MTGPCLDRGRLARIPQHPVEGMRSRRAALSRKRGDDPFDRLDRNCTNLDFFRRTGDEPLAGVDPLRQGIDIDEHSIATKNVGHQIVGKQGQPVEIVESTESTSTEGPVEISRCDLCALVERNIQFCIPGDVSIEGHREERSHESLRRMHGSIDDGLETIVMLGSEPVSEIPPRTRIEPHQLRNLDIIRILPEQLRHRLGRRSSKRFSAPAPVCLEVFPTSHRNAPIARHVRPLAQYGKPAGAKIDRVEGDHEREHFRLASCESMCGIEIVFGPALLGQAQGKGLQSPIVDLHMRSAPRHLGTSRANSIEESRRRIQWTRPNPVARTPLLSTLFRHAFFRHTPHVNEFALHLGPDMILDMSTTRRRLLLTAAMIAAIVGIGAWTRNHLGIALDAESVRDFAQSLGTAGPILFVFVVAGRAFLALPSQIVLIAAGLCFGTVVGTIVGGAGLMLSGLVLFLVARYAGREFVEKRISARSRRLLDFATYRSGAISFAVACGYPIMPLTPIQTAAGLTPMPIANFITAAFAGGSIRASIFAYFGDTLTDLSWMSLIFVGGLFAIAIAIPFAFPAGRAWLRLAFDSQRAPDQSSDA